jgi:DNA-binding IclR family transcriptional regulator
MPVEDQLKCIPEVIPHYTINTITQRPQIIKLLQGVRERGYCIDEEEFIDNVVGIGMPIFHKNDEICGLIGVTAPTIRMTCEKREKVVELLLKASKSVSDKLKYGLEDLV